jgi:hypothetical protein
MLMKNMILFFINIYCIMKLNLEFVIGANVVLACFGIYMIYTASKTTEQIKSNVNAYLVENVEGKLSPLVDEAIKTIQTTGSIETLVTDKLNATITNITSQQVTQLMREEVDREVILYKRDVIDEFLAQLRRDVNLNNIADRLATDTVFQDEIARLLATDTVFQDEVSRLLA